MRRRDFITLFGGAAAVLPRAARAQQTGKVRAIGFIGSDQVVNGPWAAGFAQRLGELGWVDGQTVAIEYRWLEGRADRAAEFAAEFVRQKVDVIVSSGIAVVTVKRATSDIPIVFAAANDPVGGGLVASLARPGGNVTGLSNEATDLASKRLALLREVAGSLHRLAILVDVGFPQSALEWNEVQAAARTLGLEVISLEIRRAEDIAPAFETLKGPVDALYVVGNALLNVSRTRIVTLALGRGIPQTLLATADEVIE